MTKRTLPTLDDALERRGSGGKAAALAVLARAGLLVPPGIVVPVGRADRLLPEAVSEILDRLAGHAPYGLIARSSASVEDGSTASFAGLFTSRLSRTDPASLLAAVRAVRDSARSATAGAYGRTMNITAAPGMAVLVQPVLRPAASGVLSAEVAAGHCARWRIEAVRGLAEPLVSGTQAGEIHSDRIEGGASVTPVQQRYLLLPATEAESMMPPGEWVSLGDGQEVVHAKIQTSADGILHLHLPAAFEGALVLGPAQRENLLAAAVTAAAALGITRVDLEWAITFDGRLQLVQGRPLTSPLLPPPPTGQPAQAVLHGLPAAPGTGTGPAVLFSTGADTADSVLVCGALGPEAVSSLLQRPAAVVSDTGGSLSHTAIIARELGIPCVTNVTTALTAIPPGTLVEVDGTTGTVRPVPAIPAPRTAQPTDLSRTAVLTWEAPTAPPGDGRLGTLILHDPQDLDPSTLLAAATVHGTAGMLLLSPSTAPAPDGYQAVPLDDLGLLFWPTAMTLPDSVAVLGPDQQILHRRTVPHAPAQ